MMLANSIEGNCIVNVSIMLNPMDIAQWTLEKQIENTHVFPLK